MSPSPEVSTDRDPRIPINLEFERADKLLRAYATNISRSGVFIRSDTTLPPGTTVRLRFTVILRDLETIEGVGRVVRISRSPAGMGVVFVDLAPPSRRLVDQIVRVGRAPVASS